MAERKMVKAAFVTRAELLRVLEQPQTVPSGLAARMAAEVFRLRAKVKNREPAPDAESTVPWLRDGQRVRGMPGTVFSAERGVLKPSGGGTWFVMDGSRILTHSTIAHLLSQFVPVFSEEELRRGELADVTPDDDGYGLAETHSVLFKRCAAAETEVERLRRCLDEMQGELDARVGQTRACADVNQQAREFAAAVDHLVGDRPRVPDKRTVRFRVRLVAEEFVELLASAYAEDPAVNDVHRSIMKIVNEGTVMVDLPELADACGDLDYVVAGLRGAFGVDGGPIAELIHAANMAKAGGPIRPTDGKRLKPEGWTPPDIEGELRRQGWVATATVREDRAPSE